MSADFTHPLPAGARKVGVLLDQALESGYRQFKAREQRQTVRMKQHIEARVSGQAGTRPRWWRSAGSRARSRRNHQRQKEKRSKKCA